MLRNKMMRVLLLWLACSAGVYAADPQQQIAPIDRIVAVVNDDVITRHELDERLDNVMKQLQKQGTSLPQTMRSAPTLSTMCSIIFVCSRE